MSAVSARRMALILPLLLTLLFGSGIGPWGGNGVAAGPAPRANAEGTPTAIGSLLTWGSDDYGQMGDGAVAPDVPAPQQVVLPTGIPVTDIASGGNHSLALLADGTVFAWGYDNRGQLGDGVVGGPDTCPGGSVCHATPQAVLLPAGARVTAIAAGAGFSLALLADGTLLAWGNDSRGQLGDGTVGGPDTCNGNPDCHATPHAVLLPPGARVTAIAAGFAHSLALLADGTVLAWGSDGFNGQLGDGTVGTPSDVPTPQPVLLPTGARVTAIAAGLNHSLALLADGTLLAWGADNFGQLGDGTAGGSSEAPTPQPVPGVTGVVAIAAGSGYNLALKADGTVVAWGRDGNGQLGDGSPQFSGCGCHPNAQPVPGLTNIVAIAAGFFHNFALKSDGTLMTWGANNNGQLGDGTTVNSGCFCRPTPQRVPGVNRVAAVIAGADTSLVILAAPTATATAADDKGAVYGAASVTLSATVTSGAGAVNGGSVTFTVKNAGSATVGVPVTGQVNATVGGAAICGSFGTSAHPAAGGRRGWGGPAQQHHRGLRWGGSRWRCGPMAG
ncbi:MAG: cell wall anchor protein [Chloroflexia bacterium]